MTKNELLAEYGKVELMLDEVSDMVNGEHHQAAGLSVKRLSLVIGNFKEKLAALPDEKPAKKDEKQAPPAAPASPAPAT